MNTGTTYTRVYLRRGRVAHLLWGSTSGWYGTPALCNQTPDLFGVWFGTGNQREIDRAASLPTCKECEKRISNGDLLEQLRASVDRARGIR